MIYLDACIAIYLVEEHPVFGPQLESALQEHEIYCVSPLVEMEGLVLPIKQQRQEIVDRFQRFFATQYRLSMPPLVFHRAAQLRAQFGLKTPGALHLATARHHRWSALWTNDERLCNVAGDLAVNMLAQEV